MNRRRNYDQMAADDYEDRPRKRYKKEEGDEEIELRLESLISRVGEKSTSSLESNIEELATVLDADLERFKDKINDSICKGVVNFPEKTCIYSTLVGLLNVKNYAFGGEIVERLVKDFKDHLKSLQFESARLLVRFFSDLVSCRVLSSTSLINLFENLVDVSMEDNIPQSRSDYFVFSVLTALPYVGKELFEKKEQDLEQLLNTIDNYMTKRNKSNHHTALRVWYSDNPHPQEEYLDCLWAQISKLRSDKWVERHIYRPYMAFDSTLCEALQHNLPPIQVPPHESNFVYPYPKVIFRLFDYTDCPDGPSLPGAHAIERYLIEEQLNWIIDKNFIDRKTCAQSLLAVPLKHKVPLEYMIIEVVFSQLFALPKSKYLDICYGSMLLELCKLQPSTLPQVLAQAVELIFERLDTMNSMCIDRFANWFAYHLSNFQFRWSWDDWSTALAMDPLHPKPKFIKETLHKCLRLSFHEHVVKIIPDSFLELAPEDPQPENKFDKEGDDAPPGTTAAKALVDAIKSKCGPEEALQALTDLENPLMETDEDATHNPLKIEVFVTVLLNMASKSLTHCFSAIAKYHSVLKELSTSEEAQICILSTIFQVWKKHQQLLVILIGKLLKSGILECSAIANWLFSKENSGEFMKTYTWEILNQTIQKSIRNVESLEKELEESKETRRKLEAGDALPGDESEAPTEEMVEKIEERLEAAESDLKNLFLIIFQRFIMLLSEHIQKCESQGKSFKSHWFRWTIGRLQQVFFEHHSHAFKYVSTFESLLFTVDLDQHILLIFKQFCSLRN